jgi:hypothetical protein
MEADDTSSVLYAGTFSDVSDEKCETETLDSVVTTSSVAKSNHYPIPKFLLVTMVLIQMRMKIMNWITLLIPMVEKCCVVQNW